MKIFVSLIVGTFLLLVILTMFTSYPPAIEDARAAGFSDSDIQTGMQYNYERRLFMWASQALELLLLCTFALTSVCRGLANRFLIWTGERRVLAALGVGFCFWFLHNLLYLPIGLLSLQHRWEWGTSNLDYADWFRDYALGSGITLATEAIVLACFYTLLIWLPRIWWLVAPAGAACLAVLYAFLSPILINPLFNDFTPLQDTEWRGQQPRVQALINQAQVPVQEILVMNGSRQSNHTNAYFTGFGPTRRIVLYDTLLKNHNADEIESILAHEIGHWQHDHINKGILLLMLGAVVGCCFLDRVLCFAMTRKPWLLQSKADPAGLALVLLLTYLGGWLVMPASNLVSRHFERQADQTSLELADVPQAFIDAELKLARVNKSNVAPTPWNVWLFATHPPTVERIQMAKDWEKRN
jgi:STE24 endopeptidase